MEIHGDRQERNTRIGDLVQEQIAGEEAAYIRALFRAMEQIGSADPYNSQKDDLLRLRELGELIVQLPIQH